LKYSLLALQNEQDEVIYEITFEDPTIIKPEEERVFVIENQQRLFKITTVTKVNHINTPNDMFDYRLLGVQI
jgi:hypothetical protein